MDSRNSPFYYLFKHFTPKLQKLAKCALIQNNRNISKFNMLSHCNWFDASICIFIVRIKGFQKFTRFFNFWIFYPKNNHFANSVSGRFLVCSKTHIMWLKSIQINSVHFFPQTFYLPWPKGQLLDSLNDKKTV